MIDCENAVFTQVYKALIAHDPSVNVVSDYTPEPERFPHVLIIQQDCMTNRNTRTCDNPENHTNVTFEISVYSNKKTGRKAEVKDLCKVIDGAMLKMGFRRVSYNNIPNIDTTVFRAVMRYYGAAGYAINGSHELIQVYPI